MKSACQVSVLPSRAQGPSLRSSTGHYNYRGYALSSKAAIARVSPTSRDLAEIAAVAGQEFDVELLREVSGWDERQVLDALNELLDRQLIREAGSRSLIDYAFSHHLIQVSDLRRGCAGTQGAASPRVSLRYLKRSPESGVTNWPPTLRGTSTWAGKRRLRQATISRPQPWPCKSTPTQRRHSI